MSKSTRGIRVAGIASLAVSLSVGVAAPALAAPGFEFTRVKGDDRYGTAVAAAEIYGASDDVILANGQPGEYADALAGNYLAGAEDAPILLTKRSGIPDVTMAQIDDIDPETIYVVGGTAAVPEDQVEALEADGYTVERVSGSDRFGTNAAVIAKDGASTDGVGLIATGLNFPDALAAGPFAYQGHSLGLVRTNSVPDVVGDALEADGVTKVLIFGGEGAVGAGVVSDLAARGITVEERFAGSDRSETSELAAEWALENLDFTDEHVGVASGYTDGFGADALAGGPVEGNENSPMLITRNVDNPDDVLDYLEAHSDTLGDGHIYGGTAAISQAAEDAMEAAAQGTEPPSNQDFTVTQETATNEFSTSGGETANRGRREYTVSGLDDTKTYAIALFRAEDVTTSQTGRVSFKDANANDVADWTKTDAVIETVNNGSVTDTDGIVLGAAPVNGVLKFTVDSLKAEEIRPVIFLDADGGSRDNDATGSPASLVDLDLDANNEPTELFAVGGQKNWVAPESATTGTSADGVVGTVNKDMNSFGLDTAPGATAANYNAADVDLTYYYDANDSFRVEGAPATLAEFEAALSRGDGVTVPSYARDDSLVSQFDITDDAPTAGSVTANPGSSGAAVNDITVVFDYGTPTTDSHYQAVLIERAPQVSGAPGTYTEVARAPISEDEDASATTFTWTDENVAAGTYYYRVAGIIDGDVGDKAVSGAATSTTPAADTTGPVANYSALVQDGGFSGDVNPGDQIRFIFNEPMTIQSGDAVRVLEGADANQTGSEERYTLTCGGNVTCSLNSAPVVIGGKSYPANTVLTVTAGVLTPDAAVTGGDNTLSVPAYITNQSGITDVAGNQWNLAGSDRNINADSAEPTMSSAVANETADTVTVTYSSPVDCANTAAVRAQFNYADATTGTPTAITCDGTTSVVLTFDNVVTGAGNLTYTESASDATVRIRGLNGVEAASPETEAAS